MFLLRFGTYWSLNALSVAEDWILLTFCEATESSLTVCREINCNLVKEIETRRRKIQRNKEKLWINAWLDDFRFIITSLHRIVGQFFGQISMRNVILWAGASWVGVLLDFGRDVFFLHFCGCFLLLVFSNAIELGNQNLELLW